MEMQLPILAGASSTVIFALSTMPMLLKAAKTKDLSSYSLGNILLSNVGNIIHSIYIFSLPIGPIWLLHSFYMVTTALMLLWYLRFEFDSAPYLELLHQWVQGQRCRLQVGWARASRLSGQPILVRWLARPRKTR